MHRDDSGQLIEQDVMAPLGLSLSEAAGRFGVEAQYFADVLSQRARINATLAAGRERARFSTARAWIEMQAA